MVKGSEALFCIASPLTEFIHPVPPGSLNTQAQSKNAHGCACVRGRMNLFRRFAAFSLAAPLVNLVDKPTWEAIVLAP